MVARRRVRRAARRSNWMRPGTRANKDRIRRRKRKEGPSVCVFRMKGNRIVDFPGGTSVIRHGARDVARDVPIIRLPMRPPLLLSLS